MGAMQYFASGHRQCSYASHCPDVIQMYDPMTSMPLSKLVVRFMKPLTVAAYSAAVRGFSDMFVGCGPLPLATLPVKLKKTVKNVNKKA